MEKEKSQQYIVSNYSLLKNLRLKNQLLILICLLIIIVIAFLAFSNYIHTNFLIEQFGRSSSQIYAMYSRNFMQTQLKGYENYFKSLFITNGQTLISYFQLYTYLRKKTSESNFTHLNKNFIMDYGGVNSKIPKSIQQRPIGPYNSTFSFMCFTNRTKFHTPYSQDELLNIKTQESMHTFGEVIFKGGSTFQSFLYAFVKRDNMLMTYPCLQRFDIVNYVPENRSWYQELTRNYKFHKPYDKYNYTLTYPYLLFKSVSVGLSMTIPFVDENLQQIGGASFDLLPQGLFKNLVQKMGLDFTSIYLVSMDGIMIMHPYNITPNQLPLYFYNQTITGFTKDDWNILRDLNESSSCKNYTFSKDFKCLYNSFYNKDMFVQVENLYSFNVSVIVLQSSSEFNKFQEQFNIELLNKLNNEFHIQVLEEACLFIFLSLLTYYLTVQLFYPIELIIETTLNQIQKKKYKSRNISALLGAFLSVQILDLYRSCQHFNKLLERFSFNKNEQCQQIEKLQYPKKKETEHNIYQIFRFAKLYKLQLKISASNNIRFVQSLFRIISKQKRQR